MVEVRRAVMRYHGGKWVLAPWIISHFTPHTTYVEPFGGAASVLLRKVRSYAEVYNDINSEVVNVFRVLRDRDQAAALTKALRLTPFAREEFEQAWGVSEEPIEQARRTLIKTFMGFSSSNIVARTGFRRWTPYVRNTTPMDDWASYPDLIPMFTERLRGVSIEHDDALEVIRRTDGGGTLYYVDPPYVLSTRDAGADYAGEMDDAAHEKLADLLHEVKGAVVLSGYRSALYDRLYSDWARVEREALIDQGMKRVECLWLSRPSARALELFSVSEVAG